VIVLLLVLLLLLLLVLTSLCSRAEPVTCCAPHPGQCYVYMGDASVQCTWISRPSDCPLLCRCLCCCPACATALPFCTVCPAVEPAETQGNARVADFRAEAADGSAALKLCGYAIEVST